MASAAGYAPVVQLLLLDGRADVTSNQQYAIRKASANGHSYVVRNLLMLPQVDATINDNEALRRAGANGHMDVQWLLLSHAPVMAELVRAYCHRALTLHQCAHVHFNDLVVGARMQAKQELRAAGDGAITVGQINAVIERVYQHMAALDRVAPQPQMDLLL